MRKLQGLGSNQPLCCLDLSDLFTFLQTSTLPTFETLWIFVELTEVALNEVERFVNLKVYSWHGGPKTTQGTQLSTDNGTSACVAATARFAPRRKPARRLDDLNTSQS